MENELYHSNLPFKGNDLSGIWYKKNLMMCKQLSMGCLAADISRKMV